jgi:hypothetical protein
MKPTSKIARLRMGLAVATLLSGIALTPAVLPLAANAGGPYHIDRLPDGASTGPLAPDAAGG